MHHLWASTFGDTVTAMELAPEGTGYRMKTRFSKFYNLPELVTMFKTFADVKTSDMLELDVPVAEYKNITIPASDFQKDMLAELADRAEACRNGMVSPKEDNMLKITTDGRKLALDPRIINPFVEEGEETKADCLVKEAIKLYREYDEDKAVQLIFCDISTPTTTKEDRLDGEFSNIYEDVKLKLMAEGVPEKEIAFIHDATTELKKDELFGKCRSGEIRFLFGSTQKLGAGTNVQTRLIGLHHLDVPWRPSDIEQQEGRIIRQGNRYDNVHIFRYVTEGTFDAYSWQIIENKQKFIGQIMTSKSPVRVADDVDESALSYAEVKALASGNPLIKERMDIEQRLTKLKVLSANYKASKMDLHNKIDRELPRSIAENKDLLERLKKDQKHVEGVFDDKEFPGLTIGKTKYDDINEAGEALIKACISSKVTGVDCTIGEYRGFKLTCRFEPFKRTAEGELSYYIYLCGNVRHSVDVGRSVTGNFLRMENKLKKIPERIENTVKLIEAYEKELEAAKIELEKPFKDQAELDEKTARLKELDDILSLDNQTETELLSDDLPMVAESRTNSSLRR